MTNRESRVSLEGVVNGWWLENSGFDETDDRVNWPVTVPLVKAIARDAGVDLAELKIATTRITHRTPLVRSDAIRDLRNRRQVLLISWLGRAPFAKLYAYIRLEQQLVRRYELKHGRPPRVSGAGAKANSVRSVSVVVDGKPTMIRTQADARLVLSRYGLANAADVFVAHGLYADDFHTALEMLAPLAKHAPRKPLSVGVKPNAGRGRSR